jgi:methionine synthase II (cobalamin-independent)
VNEVVPECHLGAKIPTDEVRYTLLVPAPDCGMKYLPRAAARDKLSKLVEATKIVRTEVA